MTRTIDKNHRDLRPAHRVCSPCPASSPSRSARFPSRCRPPSSFSSHCCSHPVKRQRPAASTCLWAPWDCPVFSSMTGGFGKFLGPTGGFLVSYPIAVTIREPCPSHARTSRRAPSHLRRHCRRLHHRHRRYPGLALVHDGHPERSAFGLSHGRRALHRHRLRQRPCSPLP